MFALAGILSLTPSETMSAHDAFPGANGKIAFVRSVGKQTIDFSIYVMDVDGSNVTRLTPPNQRQDISPAWSPDGKKIAFELFASSRNRQIYVMNGDGSDRKRVTNGPGTGEQPAWSPDGKKIVFSSWPDNAWGAPHIYVVNTDGSRERRLTDGPADGQLSPAWSPDGQRIAFVADRSNSPGMDSYSIYVMNPDGSNKMRLTSGPDDAWPAWSPDGKKIVFTRGDHRGHSFLYVMNADGSKQTRLTDGPNDFDPAWSPDASQIIFDRRGAAVGSSDIYVMNADGSAQRKIVDSRGVAWRAYLQADWQPATEMLINVTDVAVDNGRLTVSWKRTALTPRSPITSYVVAAVPARIGTVAPWGNNRRDQHGRVIDLATQVTDIAGPSETSAGLGGLIADCHQVYEVTVTPMMDNVAGRAADWRYPVRPSGVVSPMREPDRVVILLDGVAEAKPAERFDPFNPTVSGTPSYCPEAWDPAERRWAKSNFARSSSGPRRGPWEFFNKWNFADPASVDKDADEKSNSTPRELDVGVNVPTHSFMLDAVAAKGSIILPYSYTGATLGKHNGRPFFTFSEYSFCDSTPSGPAFRFPIKLCPPSRSIDEDAKKLNDEIASIHSVWHDTAIIVVGHSQGGLIAFRWWDTYGYGALRGSAAAAVAHVFTLDSPVNGVCAVGGPLCGGPPSYPDYNKREANDKTFLAKDAAAGWPVHFIGTSGDTVPLAFGLRGYGSAGKENLQHQLMVTGDNCSDQRDNADCPAPPDHVSGCPVTDRDGNPLVPSWASRDEHFIVKFCPDNVTYFNNVLGLDYPG